jgi:NAD(P)-dependent dehydrogenase (short-subunit alcohol dehydrogenase family)
LLEASAKVHILDLSEIPVHEDTPGQQVSHPSTDVAARDSVKAALDKIAAQDSHLNGLVNCAGVLRPTDGSAESDKTFQLLWDVNVRGTWNTNTEFYHLVKDIRKREPDGQSYPPVSIVNVGSMASVRGLPGMSGYVATKHAVLGLSRTWAQEWGPEGFRVNTVAPGAVNTPMIAGVTGDGSRNGAYQGAFKSLSEPEEIADVIMYLLGDGSSSISGQLIEVNGGWP